MAATYRQLYVTFWSDEFILNLSSEEKLFYNYLLTNQYVNFCGIYVLTIKMMMRETGLSSQKIKKALKLFSEKGKVVYSALTDEVCLCNWLKYNCPGSAQQIKGVLASLEGVKDRNLLKYLADLKKITDTVTDTVSDTVTDTVSDTVCHTKELELELELEHKNKNKNKNTRARENKPVKNQYAEFVSLTNDEYTSLVAKYGEYGTKRLIEILDNYKGAKGAKYESDYRAILNWVIKRWEDERRKADADGGQNDLFMARLQRAGFLPKLEPVEVVTCDD